MNCPQAMLYEFIIIVELAKNSNSFSLLLSLSHTHTSVYVILMNRDALTSQLSINEEHFAPTAILSYFLNT